MKLTNKAVLITGANRGIGRALVDEALRRGAARVYAGTRGAWQHADPRVTTLTLDVTNPAQVERAAGEVEHLDILFNNAGIALPDDLSRFDLIEQHLAVNFLGALRVTHAFLPHLRRSRGAIVNTLSLAALAAVPILPAYSISKAAAFNMTQSLRAVLAGEDMMVHAAVLGPIDTEMSRDLAIPKASAESTARRMLDGVEAGAEDIFPDPVSSSIAESWSAGAAKTLERQFAGFVAPPTVRVA